MGSKSNSIPPNASRTPIARFSKSTNRAMRSSSMASRVGVPIGEFCLTPRCPLRVASSSHQGGIIASHTELRIHGVSGTAPRDMLYTDPITNDLADDYTQIYEFPAQDPAFETRAFHWGGLTSGSPITAFGILPRA